MTNLIPLGSRDILGKTATAFGTAENPLFNAKHFFGIFPTTHLTVVIICRKIQLAA
jgi:hypothetical protein